MQRIAIIDAGTGNLRSLAKAFDHFGCQTIVTNRPAEIARADRIVLPGQGAFANFIAGIKRFGLETVIQQQVQVEAKPFLGICVGMQVLTQYGLEYQRINGFGWIDGYCKRFASSGSSAKEKLRIPHVGWNKLIWAQGNDNFTAGLQQVDYVYFSHSYYCNAVSSEIVLASCAYGIDFPAIVRFNNCIGVQFHPEKSQVAGLHILQSFLTWQP